MPNRGEDAHLCPILPGDAGQLEHTAACSQHVAAEVMSSMICLGNSPLDGAVRIHFPNSRSGALREPRPVVTPLCDDTPKLSQGVLGHDDSY